MTRPRFSETLMDHCESPRNGGALAGATHVGHGSMGDRGPWITIWLRAVEGVVEQASFASQGCGVATACGSILTELIEGKSLPECLAITLEDVERALEWIPADKRYCAEVAVRALAMAAGGGVRVS